MKMHAKTIPFKGVYLPNVQRLALKERFSQKCVKEKGKSNFFTLPFIRLY